MRILMITDVYFPRVNGVSTSISLFKGELQRLGHQVTLIAPAYPGAEKSDAGVIYIPSRHLFFDPEDRMMSVRSILVLKERLRKVNFDLLHIHTPFVAHYAGVRLARYLGIPRIETFHTFFEEYLHHYFPVIPKAGARWAARELARNTCKRLDGVVVPSVSMLKVLRNYGIQTRLGVVPTGIDLRQFTGGNGERFRRANGIPLDRPVIGYIGRVAHEKNIDFLLRMLAALKRQVPDVLLLIAGEGPAVGLLRRCVAELALTESVLFVGYLSRDGELQDCYRAADVFVFASRTETQGLVLVEAMASGVPVVSTAVLGTGDFLEHGAGALISVENEKTFASDVASLLERPSVRAALGQKARDHAENWSVQAMGARLVEFYDTVLRASRDPLGSLSD